MAKKSMNGGPTQRNQKPEKSPEYRASELVCEAIDLLECGLVCVAYEKLRCAAVLLPKTGHLANDANPYPLPKLPPRKPKPKAGRGFSG